MSTITNQNLRQEYVARINRVMDYVEQNLANAFTLEEMAGVANFSKYHFNRIFWAMTGERPFQFVSRIRLERAAFLIIHSRHAMISDIADECGFSEISVFSRNFKNHFGISPTAWRNTDKTESNNRQMHRKIYQPKYTASPYFCSDSQTLKWRSDMKQNKGAEVKELPEMTLAYIRHTDPYQGDEQLFERLFNKLFTWAGPRGLLEQQDMKSIVVYHDDPSVTEEDKLRMSVSLTVPKDTKVDGEFGKMTIEGGKYLVADFELTASDYADAWSWVYGSWFPESGYQPADGACFEMYTKEPEDGVMPVSICVPVKAL
ncbi:MAG: AraC family transcriptional regulator [Bacteroidota bacterium]